MRKEYLLIGSNNFWYASHTNKRDAKAEAKNIIEGEGSYSNPENYHEPDPPQEVFIYEAREIDRVSNDERWGVRYHSLIRANKRIRERNHRRSLRPQHHARRSSQSPPPAR